MLIWKFFQLIKFVYEISRSELFFHITLKALFNFLLAFCIIRDKFGMYPFEGEVYWSLISHTGIIIMDLWFFQQVCSRFADIYIHLCCCKIINKNLKHSTLFSQLSPFVLVSVILIVYFGTLLSICFKNLLIFCFFFF